MGRPTARFRISIKDNQAPAAIEVELIARPGPGISSAWFLTADNADIADKGEIPPTIRAIRVIRGEMLWLVMRMRLRHPAFFAVN